MKLNIIFPVLNEKLRLTKGIDTCMAYMKEHIHIPFELTIVDNGSTDETQQIGMLLEACYEEVRYVRIEERGVGIAFKTGVLMSDADIVGYMDIDLSTDLKYLSKMLWLFKKHPELEYVNGSRFSPKSDTQGRLWYRKITSAGLVFMLKGFFGMKATDALCGFTFLRTDVAKKLVNLCSDDHGWFYTVELLLRAERLDVNIYDMPVEWIEDYNTTVNVPKTIKNYLIQMAKLKVMFIKEGLKTI